MNGKFIEGIVILGASLVLPAILFLAIVDINDGDDGAKSRMELRVLETELHIKVLKLQLSAYEDTVRPPETPDTTTDAYEWADGLEGVELKEFYEGGYGL